MEEIALLLLVSFIGLISFIGIEMLFRVLSKRIIKPVTNKLEKIRLQKVGSCIDVYDLEGNMLIRIAPHYTMKQDRTRITEEYSGEISEVIVNFYKYYNAI
jgi:hypothetical protein